jgi:hypothetical protein
MKLLRTSLLVVTLAAVLGGTGPMTAESTPSAAMNAASTSPVSGAASSVADRAADEADRAPRILDDLRAKYRYLDGVTVSLGTTPRGEQAVAYYTEDRIVIDRAHEASIEKILAHEVWHIIDWRDNGRLDWGEDLPPDNTYAYLNP